MANIDDYLDWRGDLPFSRDPFNEVDNLILSFLAYVDYEGTRLAPITLPVISEPKLPAIPKEAKKAPNPPEEPVRVDTYVDHLEGDESYALRDVASDYFDMYTEEEIIARNTTYRMSGILLRHAAQSVRYRDVRIRDYLNVIDTETEEQISAVTFVLPGNVYYIAFRGTDNTLVGWKEDFKLSYRDETEGQRRALQYVNGFMERVRPEQEELRKGYIRMPRLRLMIGGHSKGGNFAVYTGCFSDPAVRKKIIKIYSNDGPGFREEIINSREYKKMLPKVVSIVPEESFVSTLLSSDYDTKVIKSDEKGFMQHAPMSWQIKGNAFVASERGQGSIMLERTVTEWLGGLSDEDKEIFTDLLFDLLDRSGARTLDEISLKNASILPAILNNFKSMPKDKQDEMLSVIGKLIRAGQDIYLSEQVKGRQEKIEVLRTKGEEISAGIKRKQEIRKEKKEERKESKKENKKKAQA